MKLIKIPSAAEQRKALVKRGGLVVLVVAVVGAGVAWWLLREVPRQEELTEPGRFELRSDEAEGAQARFDERAAEVNVDELHAPDEKYSYYIGQSDELMVMGRYDEAIEMMKKAEASGVKLTYDFYFSYGLAYEAKQDNQAALTQYQKAYEMAKKSSYEDNTERQNILFDIYDAIQRVRGEA